MKCEIRSDGLHISGYVNVPGRQSRPLATARGRVIEVIEQGAFGKAIENAGEIRMLQDHNPERVLATTTGGTLKVKEDAVGLRAESVVTDDSVIMAAKEGRLKGWSFNMRNVSDEMENRAEGELPVRHVKGFNMDEISLIIDKIPCYSSTSVEVRGEEPEDIETRSDMEAVEVITETVTESQTEEEHVTDPETGDWRAKITEYRIRLEKITQNIVRDI